MTDPLLLVLSWTAGGLLGAMFFGGLWWTIRKGVSSTQPALWFVGSLLLRVSITLTGFYFVAGHHWQRLLLSLLGFFMASIVVARLTRPLAEDHRSAREAGYAP